MVASRARALPAVRGDGQGISAGDRLVAIAVTPDGKTAYVSNSGSGTVTPVSTTTNTAGPPIPVGTNPGPIAITR